jgi:hypothetical protein
VAYWEIRGGTTISVVIVSHTCALLLTDLQKWTLQLGQSRRQLPSDSLHWFLARVWVIDQIEILICNHRERSANSSNHHALHTCGTDYNLIEAEVTKQYGSNFGFERVWYKTSHEAFISILNGTTDATEPYMFVGSACEFYGDHRGVVTSVPSNLTSSSWCLARLPNLNPNSRQQD